MATPATTTRLKQQLEALLFRATQVYKDHHTAEAATLIRQLAIWRYGKPFQPLPVQTLGGIVYFLEQMEKERPVASNDTV